MYTTEYFYYKHRYLVGIKDSYLTVNFNVKKRAIIIFRCFERKGFFCVISSMNFRFLFFDLIIFIEAYIYSRKYIPKVLRPRYKHFFLALLLEFLTPIRPTYNKKGLNFKLSKDKYLGIFFSAKTSLRKSISRTNGPHNWSKQIHSR